MESEILYKTTKYCPTCNSMVEAGVLFSYHIDIMHIDELQNEGTSVTLSKCLNCSRPFLTEEDFVNIEEHSWNNNKRQLYPSEENQSISNAPDIICNPFKEAQKCYKVQAYDACVIMCRKGIEAICTEQGENKGTLAQKLKNLKEKKQLEETFFKWANELRLIGNDGAHAHKQIVTQQDAADTLEFFEALIIYLYHLVYQYEKLRERREKTAKP